MIEGEEREGDKGDKEEKNEAQKMNEKRGIINICITRKDISMNFF